MWPHARLHTRGYLADGAELAGKGDGGGDGLVVGDVVLGVGELLAEFGDGDERDLGELVELLGRDLHVGRELLDALLDVDEVGVVRTLELMELRLALPDLRFDRDSLDQLHLIHVTLDCVCVCVRVGSYRVCTFLMSLMMEANETIE